MIFYYKIEIDSEKNDPDIRIVEAIREITSVPPSEE